MKTVNSQRKKFSPSLKKLNGNEEFEALKADASNYELEALADKCFSILGKTTANFAISTPKKKKLSQNPLYGRTQDESKK